MKWYRKIKENDCIFKGCIFKRINKTTEKCINCGIRRKYESKSDN